MSIPNLPINFKDDILAATNPKRKYNLIQNDDGTVSFEDATEYQQTGSDFGAGQINATNDAINKIYSERILSLEEAALVTETGFFVDAMVVSELIGDLDKRVSGTRQTGTGGWIYACKNGGFIDIAVNLSGCLVGKTYEWYNIGYVDITSLGATKTDAAFGLASFSNAGGPEFGDTGGKTTISCVAQATGRIQLRAQSSKTISEGRQYIAMIKVPITD